MPIQYIATFATTPDYLLGFRNRQALLSSQSAAIFTHYIRANCNAILVGINTVIIDNPLSSVRHIPCKKQPMVIVLDSQLRTPLTSRFLDRSIIFCQENVDENKKKELEKQDSMVIKCQCFDLDIITSHLEKIGFKRVMIEGGSRILKSFLEKYEMDVFWTVTQEIEICQEDEPVYLSNNPLSGHSGHKINLGADIFLNNFIKLFIFNLFYKILYRIHIDKNVVSRTCYRHHHR